jgi:hypothetical protein
MKLGIKTTKETAIVKLTNTFIKWNPNRIRLNIFYAYNFIFSLLSSLDIKCNFMRFHFTQISVQIVIFFTIKYMSPLLLIHKTAYIFFKWVLSLQLCLIKSLNYKEVKWCNYYESCSLPVNMLFLLPHLLLSQQQQSELVKWH